MQSSKDESVLFVEKLAFSFCNVVTDHFQIKFHLSKIDVCGIGCGQRLKFYIWKMSVII